MQCVIDAYVVYDQVSDDGSVTVGPPRVETFDTTFFECPECGWKLEKVTIELTDRVLCDELA
ncbi:MAG TPA: hypothetical protein VN193_02720 [Candidatus Angelobacter sp.]|nr:hypothetical protein [Candidatus Angelobacter sp.]